MWCVANLQPASLYAQNTLCSQLLLLRQPIGDGLAMQQMLLFLLYKPALSPSVYSMAIHVIKVAVLHGVSRPFISSVYQAMQCKRPMWHERGVRGAWVIQS